VKDVLLQGQDQRYQKEGGYNSIQVSAVSHALFIEQIGLELKKISAPLEFLSRAPKL
jgi:hypothetical protein